MTSRGRGLHEAAHVVQQRGGVQLKGGVGTAGDAHEQHADRVADLVTAGQSAEAELDRYAGRGGPPAVQRKPGDAPSPHQPAGTHVDRLIQLLATPPAAGHDDVYTLLLSLNMPAPARRWKWELRPMTSQQRAAVTTVTVGGMLLLIAMILLAPVGA